MAILLKDQLDRKHFLKEISYKGPVFDDEFYSQIKYYEKIPRAAGVQLFYDLYAIYGLWLEYGFGLMSRKMRHKAHSKDAAGEEWTSTRPLTVADERGTFPQSQSIITNRALYSIHELFGSVVYSVGMNLEMYLKYAIMQEFRYVSSSSCKFKSFRHRIVNLYERKKKADKSSIEYNDSLIYVSDFKRLFYKNNINISYSTAYKLLEFCKLEDPIYASDHKEAFDIVAELLKDPSEKHFDDSSEKDGGEYDFSGDYFKKYSPDSDYEQAKKWGKEHIKTSQLMSKLIRLRDRGEISDKTFEKYKKALSKKFLTEGKINLSIVNRVEKHMEESGIGWNDVSQAFDNLEWSPAYGGEKWASATRAYLKLKEAIDNGVLVTAPDDAMMIIDHIYSLEHNTGMLLNKGPMYVPREHLDRRFRMQHWINFLPYVSSKIRNLLIVHSKINSNARREYAIYRLRETPPEEFTPVEVDRLYELGFELVPSEQRSKNDPEQTYKSPRIEKNRFRIRISYKSEKGPLDVPVYLEISKHRKKYVISLELEHKFIYFNTFEKAIAYLNSRDDLIKSSPPPAADETEKDAVISNFATIKLSKEKEEILLDQCKMGWKENHYEAYFSGNLRFRMYAFYSGIYLCTYNNTSRYKIFHSWEKTLNYCRYKTEGAVPHPEPEKVKLQMTTPSTDGIYALKEDQYNAIIRLVESTFIQTGKYRYRFVKNHQGELTVFRESVTLVPLFSVRKLNVEGKDEYTVFHYLSTISKKSYTFNNWNSAFAFISRNIQKLSLPKSLSSPANLTVPTSMDSIFTEVLPPHAKTRALYTAHVGIDQVPKSSIRLTEEDENKLISVGFMPKMVGTEVWYIHKYNNDTLKFYANNVAVILKTTYSISKSKMSILEAIDWAISNYSQTQTPSLKFSPISAPAAENQNTKIGTMFEKYITGAGFQWDESTKTYIDGNNKIVINPFPKSTLYIGNKIMTFNGLLDLVEFVIREYPQIKNS